MVAAIPPTTAFPKTVDVMQAAGLKIQAVTRMKIRNSHNYAVPTR